MKIRQMVRPRWQIGILSTPVEKVISGEDLCITWVANPFHDRWFADPFILSVNQDELTLLVEDYLIAEQKGRISRIVVDRKRGAIVSCKPILEGGHYSFPAILRKDRRVYIYPEQSRHGRLDLFEYCPETETCKFVETLSEEPLTDAIIYKGEIYSTRMPEPNGKTLISSSVLRTFKYPSDVQDAALQRSNVFGECIARNAGDFFDVDGVTYRPAQECNRWYGNALSIQKYENGVFTEIRRIPGIHTLNSYEGVTVVDRKIFPCKWLYWLLRRTDK